MMCPMHATDTLDVETFASPVQQRRFVKAMERIAHSRKAGTPVRVFVSAAPRIMNNPKWDGWLGSVTKALPSGVDVLHYRNAFASGQYDWESLAKGIDGLVVLGKQKRPGSRVYLLGPVARLELRSLIAQKPVLLYGHSLGLIPVIDCKSQVLAPAEAPRLKLTAPKRWKDSAGTLKAALGALNANSSVEAGESAAEPPYLMHPFTPTQRGLRHQTSAG